MRFVGTIMIILFIPSMSLASRGIERINFFPEADAFLRAGYSHSQLNIETPRTTVNTKELNNIYNLFTATYAHRAARKWFLGVTLAAEEASENAAFYGLPLRRRSTSSGLMNPGLFSLYRLRHQKGDRGNIDFFIEVSPNLGPRKISRTSSNRFSGKNRLDVGLSHGFLEEKWEFKNELGYTFFAAGKEQNRFLDSTFEVENFFHVQYKFTTQYALKEKLHVFLSLGIFYRSNERIREKSGEMRELKSGTGSDMGLGLKHSLSAWTMIELSYRIQRTEYFLKTDQFSLDGNFLSQSGNLTYTVLF